MTHWRAEITGLKDDIVQVRIVQVRMERRPAGASRPGPLRILLNGEPAGFAEPLRRGRDGVAKLLVRLPPDRVAVTLDIVDCGSGRKLLDGFDLTGHYRLRIESIALDGFTLSGRFTIAPELGDLVWVHLLKDAEPIAGCDARRQGHNAAGFIYAFTTPLPVLAELHQGYTLGVRVAGAAAETAATMALTHERLGVIGYIEKTTSEAVLGWATRIPHRKQPVMLDFLADGAVIATRKANAYREDLHAIGFGDGNLGFAFPIPQPRDGKSARTLGVVIAGSGTHLANSPVALRSADRLIGNFDGLQGRIAGGWASDLDAPDRPVQVEIVCEDRVFAAGTAQIYRADVEASGRAPGRCGFRIDLGDQFRACIGKEVSARIHGLPFMLPGSPRIARENPNIRRFLDSRAELTGAKLARLKHRLNHRARGQAISIVMPVHNTPRKWLRQALDSVRGQWCDYWELVCVDDASTEPHVAEMLKSYAAADRRIRVISAQPNGGIARATNFGVRAARFPYIAFMDHDDFLEPDAVYRLIRAIQDSEADLLYSDEVLTGRELNSVVEVRARPAFSYDYYLSHPYFVHMLCVRTAIAHRVAGWDESLPISADVDFVLRALEVAEKVAHVPAVLYRWRTHETSAGHAKQSEVMETTRGAIRRHLERRGIAAKVSDGFGFNEFRIDWPDPGGQILIVIPTRNKHDLLRACIDSIERTADRADYRIVVVDHESDEADSRAYLRRIARRHAVMPYKGKFNFAAMNNLAVRRRGADAAFVLFLNNDIEALENGWLPRLRSLAGRADVGAVGPLLLYDDRTVQHAGVILGFNNGAEHVGKFLPATTGDGARRNPGYNDSLTSVRDFSAVTAACMMMRKSVFDSLGGFDEAFAIGFNDTDLCLRVRERGLKVIYDGHTMLLHHESATRSETREVLHPEDAERLRARWARYFADGDPFYNPLLDLVATDHVLREDIGCKQRQVARVTEVALGAAEPAVSRRPPKPPSRQRLKRSGAGADHAAAD